MLYRLQYCFDVIQSFLAYSFFLNAFPAREGFLNPLAIAFEPNSAEQFKNSLFTLLTPTSGEQFPYSNHSSQILSKLAGVSNWIPDVHLVRNKWMAQAVDWTSEPHK